MQQRRQGSLLWAKFLLQIVRIILEVITIINIAPSRQGRMLWAEILLSSSSSTFLAINSVSDWVRTLRGRSLCFALLLPGKESRPYVLLEGLAHSSICLGCSSSYSKIKTNLDQGRTHTTCAPWTFGGEHEGKLWCSTKSAELFLLKQFTCP